MRICGEYAALSLLIFLLNVSSSLSDDECTMMNIRGRKPVPGSCVKYLECTWTVSNTYEFEEHKCLAPRIYDEKVKECITPQSVSPGKTFNREACQKEDKDPDKEEPGQESERKVLTTKVPRVTGIPTVPVENEEESNESPEISTPTITKGSTASSTRIKDVVKASLMTKATTKKPTTASETIRTTTKETITNPTPPTKSTTPKSTEKRTLKPFTTMHLTNPCTMATIHDRKPIPGQCTRYLECMWKDLYNFGFVVQACPDNRIYEAKIHECVSPDYMNVNQVLNPETCKPEDKKPVGPASTLVFGGVQSYTQKPIATTTTTTTKKPLKDVCTSINLKLKKPMPHNCTQYLECVKLDYGSSYAFALRDCSAPKVYDDKVHDCVMPGLLSNRSTCTNKELSIRKRRRAESFTVTDTEYNHTRTALSKENVRSTEVFRTRTYSSSRRSAMRKPQVFMPAPTQTTKSPIGKHSGSRSSSDRPKDLKNKTLMRKHKKFVPTSRRTTTLSPRQVLDRVRSIKHSKETIGKKKGKFASFSK